MAAQAIKQAVQQVASKGPRTVLELKLSCYDNRVVKMAERLKMAADMLNIKVYTLLTREYRSPTHFRWLAPLVYPHKQSDGQY
jgi:hypothetical protein